MEDLKDTLSWSRFYSYRKEIRRLYPSVYNLRIRKKLSDVIIDEIKDGALILDVGASTKILGEKIRHKFPGIIFKTMDIDKTQPHDYYSLEEIPESFDIIILSEVIEHLDFKEGISLLKKLFNLINLGGKIIVSTPNIHHPSRYWWDPDHKTPYHYDGIGGALLAAGFGVEKMFRTYNDQVFRRLFRMYVASHLHRYLDVDFAKSIIAVAVKK